MSMLSPSNRAHPYSIHFEEKKRFFQRNLHYFLVWPLLATVIAATGWFFLLNGLDTERQKVDYNGLQAAAALSQDNAEDVRHTLESVNYMTFYVKNGWEASTGQFRLDDPYRSKRAREDFSFHISVIDEYGDLVASTVSSPQKVNVANRRYFSAHTTAADLFYAGPTQIGDFSKKPITPFSRRLANARGDFKGIVLVSMTPDYFTSAYDDAILKQNGVFALFDADHSIHIARIGRQILIPGAQLLTALPTFESPSGSTLLNGKEWFPDQKNRYVGWETIDEYGLTLLIGLDQDEFLAPYRGKRTDLIRNAILITLALASLSLMAAVSAMYHLWRKFQFEALRATYRAATESADEGFYIVSPVWNEAGEVTDFTIKDCNERGAEFLRYRRDELLGKSILQLYHGAVADRTMRMLYHAMKHGSYEGETDMATLGIEGPTWLHIRISRPDHDLAITMRDISATKAHVVELERRGNEDALTGLPNRNWVMAFLPEALQKTLTDQTMMGLLFIDLDGFKAVNDTMGHEAGDEVLRNAGRRLRDAVRPHDHVVRLGGDEFLVILQHLKNNEEAAHVAERILNAFLPPFRVGQGVHSIGTSIGITMFPKDGSDAPTLLKNADIAMYSVKASGKRDYRFFDRSFYDALLSRHQKEDELRHALDHNQMVVFYQPKVDISTGITSSLEALVRWAHPTQGIVGPNDFMSIAREAGLMAKIGEQVIEKVCAQLAQWAKHSQQLVPVSINVCASQFKKSNVLEIISASLKRHGIPASLIEIEITESTMLDHTDEVIGTIKSLQQMGITLSVDDFGTGYSSLSQLQNLDFDVLKVDQAFTAKLNRSKDGNILFTTIIKMAHSLGMRVVAEGVETLEQIKLLKAMECDEVQGFYISKPVPPAETQPILPRWFFPSTT